MPVLHKICGDKKFSFEEIKSVKFETLSKRIDAMILYFRSKLKAFKAYCKKNPTFKYNPHRDAKTGGDYSMGRTVLDPSITNPDFEIPRDKDGSIIYPINISSTLQILNLGTIDFKRDAFHSSRNIFPIGYKCVRVAPSMFDRANKRANYICEILDGGDKGPIFRVTSEEDSKNPIIRDASSAAWIEIMRKVNELNSGRREKVTVSGPERYGFSEPSVHWLISTLPNAEKCKKYRNTG